MTVEALEDVERRWRATWPRALATWGRTSRLHAPVLHTDPCGMPSWAWYSLDDVEVHVDLTVVQERHIEDHALAVLAHEIGHHLLAPVDWASQVRIAARVRVGLVDLDHLVGLVANLWCDLLINDRLQRQLGVDRAALSAAVGPPDPDNALMLLVSRTNEILWGLERGTLIGDQAAPDDQAQLCARLVRAYARDPVGGAAGFATLVRTTIPVEQLRAQEPGTVVACGGPTGGDGSLPFGVATDPTLGAPALHPSRDPRVVGVVETSPDAEQEAPSAPAGGGNSLAPGALHAVLQALGSPTTAEDVAIAWYRAQAARHLVPFPTRPMPRRAEELLAGLEPWEVGDDLSTVDWTGTVTASPVVVPGMTTVRRAYLDDPEESVEARPVDLDLYLDSSGSMPDPRRARAPIALAGAILALSALRAGARVQATTWSGPNQVAGTDGFTRDADAVLRAVVAYFGQGTAFPLDLLRRTHLGDPASGAPPARRGPTHIAVISDDGVETMFWGHGRRNDPTAGEALRAADGGGTLVLQVPADWAARFESRADGYAVHSVVTEDDLLTFVRRMAASTWGGDRGPSTR
ncbi:hypothetical protein ASD16_20495 [Cellulomonas sp. Root485]|uniref:hypothetical protein n=1 Tax=Cellulomonas sp. Root485 TaxID=1736546 RepID=UPI0006F42EB6|nr:hypothetical protein [Cellulomonas sp. Root485]KQY20676.1 hypothetical protein ASD16_20495 [Cellulomonas sp. Root485]